MSVGSQNYKLTIFAIQSNIVIVNTIILSWNFIANLVKVAAIYIFYT